MALTTKNWTLNSYTIDTWTDLVAEPSTLATTVVSNPTGSSITVQMRLEDAGSGLATIIPSLVIAAGDSQVIEVRSLNVTGTQAIQVQADVTGAEFYASGVSYN